MAQLARERTIADTPVRADLSLSREEINKLVYEIIQDPAWEGRPLGRIEIIHDKQWIHIYSYEQPVTQLVPIKMTSKETMQPFSWLKKVPKKRLYYVLAAATIGLYITGVVIWKNHSQLVMHSPGPPEGVRVCGELRIAGSSA